MLNCDEKSSLVERDHCKTRKYGEDAKCCESQNMTQNPLDSIPKRNANVCCHAVNNLESERKRHLSRNHKRMLDNMKHVSERTNSWILLLCIWAIYQSNQPKVNFSMKVGDVETSFRLTCSTHDWNITEFRDLMDWADCNNKHHEAVLSKKHEKYFPGCYENSERQDTRFNQVVCWLCLQKFMSIIRETKCGKTMKFDCKPKFHGNWWNLVKFVDNGGQEITHHSTQKRVWLYLNIISPSEYDRQQPKVDE